MKGLGVCACTRAGVCATREWGALIANPAPPGDGSGLWGPHVGPCPPDSLVSPFLSCFTSTLFCVLSEKPALPWWIFVVCFQPPNKVPLWELGDTFVRRGKILTISPWSVRVNK